jgi:hypothetical protein
MQTLRFLCYLDLERKMSEYLFLFFSFVCKIEKENVLGL